MFMKRNGSGTSQPETPYRAGSNQSRPTKQRKVRGRNVMSGKVAQRPGMRKMLCAANQSEHATRVMSRAAFPLLSSESEEEVATTNDHAPSQTHRRHPPFSSFHSHVNPRTTSARGGNGLRKKSNAAGVCAASGNLEHDQPRHPMPQEDEEATENLHGDTSHPSISHGRSFHVSSSESEPQQYTARRRRLHVSPSESEAEEYTVRRQSPHISSSEREADRLTTCRRRSHNPPSESESDLCMQRSHRNNNNTSELCNFSLEDKEGGSGKGGDGKGTSDSNLQPHCSEHRANPAKPRTTEQILSACETVNLDQADWTQIVAGSVETFDLPNTNTPETDCGEAITGAARARTVQLKRRDCDGEDISDFMANFSTPKGFDVAALIDEQQEKLVVRRRSSNFGENLDSKRRLHHRRKVPRRYAESDEECPTKSIRDMWVQCLQRQLRRDPEFFSSDEAMLKERSTINGGKTGYASLKVHESNCHDIQRVFTLKYEAKSRLGQPTNSYDQFKTVVGQYARFCCVKGSVSPTDLWKRGSLFSLVLDHEALRAFIQYFQLRGTPSTVVAKTLHLKTLASYAETYFAEDSDVNQPTKLRLKDASLWLSSVHNAEKTEGRRMTRLRRDVSDRLARMAILLPKDFVNLQKVSIVRMNGVMETYHKNAQSLAPHVLSAYIVRSRLLEKFCINLQVCLLLSGGGQRPQVFTQLLAPSPEEMRELRMCSQKMDFIELSTMHEKRARPLDFPFVTFSAKVFPYIEFYMDKIRPVILQKVRIVEDSAEPRLLFMDTRNARMLQSHQIRRTLKNFTREIDPELSNITPMALRGSYATWMLHKYRTGTIFIDKTENEFLEYLAKGMNTSVEQLRNTYAGIEREDYRSVTRELIAAFETVHVESNCEQDEVECTQFE